MSSTVTLEKPDSLKSLSAHRNRRSRVSAERRSLRPMGCAGRVSEQRASARPAVPDFRFLFKADPGSYMTTSHIIGPGVLVSRKISVIVRLAVRAGFWGISGSFSADVGRTPSVPATSSSVLANRFRYFPKDGIEL